MLTGHGNAGFQPAQKNASPPQALLLGDYAMLFLKLCVAASCTVGMEGLRAVVRLGAPGAMRNRDCTVRHRSPSRNRSVDRLNSCATHLGGKRGQGRGGAEPERARVLQWCDSPRAYTVVLRHSWLIQSVALEVIVWLMAITCINMHDLPASLGALDAAGSSHLPPQHPINPGCLLPSPRRQRAS